MISIDWDNLEHAYGKASDIPKLLDDLKGYPPSPNYEAEPFFTLWSSLCHQGDIYSASYAAVPFIVAAIESNPEKVSSDYFLLPVCIEVARLQGNGPKIDNELKKPYWDALTRLRMLAGRIETSEYSMAKVLSATIAVCSGNGALASAILELTRDQIEDA